MEKKSNHKTLVVRLGEARVHTNADTLEIFDIPDTSYQVVTKKGQFKAGDLAVYIQPDSIVPQTNAFKFIWGEFASPLGFVSHGPCPYSEVPERRRRITVRKFRKEWSEGLLMPISDFGWLYYSKDGQTWAQYDNTVGGTTAISEGCDVSDTLGITHWEGEIEANTGGGNESRPKRKYPKTLRGWFFFLLFKLGIGGRRQLNEELSIDVPKYDVESIKNYKNALVAGEQVIITEKIHGSQGRYFFKDGHMYAGSRNFWKAKDSPCVWRKVLERQPWIESWCRAHEGEVLYGEVVPTQKNFKYGYENGESNFYVFDIRGVDGNYYNKEDVFHEPVNAVPILYQGDWQETLLAKHMDGKSNVLGATNLREGCVVTALDPTRWQRNLGRVHLKAVSNAFLEKDSK